MQHRVDLANRGVAPIHFLCEVLGRRGVMTLFAQIVSGVNQHPAAAGSRVINRVAGTRFENPHQRIHHFGRGEKLAGFRPGIVGELLDQVFIGPPQNVGRHTAIGKIMLIEMLNQCMNHFVGDEGLATAIGRRLIPVHSKHALEFLIGIGDRTHGLGQLLANFLRNRPHIAPLAPGRDVEPIFATRPEDRFLCLGECATLLFFLFGNGVVRLVLPLIAQALIEHQRQNVILVILPGGFAAQNIGRSPQVGFQLLLSQAHRGDWSIRAGMVLMGCRRSRFSGFQRKAESANPAPRHPPAAWTAWLVWATA